MRSAQLDRQIRRARARDLAFLARAREHAFDLLLDAQRRDRLGVFERLFGGGSHLRMMYGGSDAALDLGPPSGWPQGPGDGVRVPGLERRRRRRLERRLVPRLGARRAPLRADRVRGVLRLPGQPPLRPLRRRGQARDRLAHGRGLRGDRPASAARPRARPGRRAVDALAGLLRAADRPRRGARRAAGGLARRAARRRTPHASGRR